MQKIKNISIIFLIFLLCLSNFFVISLASSVEVTKENLEQAFDDLMASNVLESAPDITETEAERKSCRTDSGLPRSESWSPLRDA